jgi:hypothetical protein
MKEEEEGKMITNWLDKHGNPDIEKQVEKQLMDKIVLEEAVERYGNKKGHIPTTELEDAIFKQGFTDGAKWQAERMYSEEEVVGLLNFVSKEYNISNGIGWFHTHESNEDISSKEVLDKFKKK